jgi:NAD(P)H dehydrogenase (quinone)
MILVSGASGKTGRALLCALSALGQPVRAMIHHSSLAESIKHAGAVEVVVADMLSQNDWLQAAQGVQSIYHICPNMHPDEIAIGTAAIQAARHCEVAHFVFHSVLHPHAEAMPHHWKKMRVEEMLFESSLDFTILQPTSYMQNLLAYWQSITEEHHLVLPYSPPTRLSLVDLQDVATVAALVLTQPGHIGAIYELVGTPPLSQAEVAATLTHKLGFTVQVESISHFDWESQARDNSMSTYSIETLLKMFHYYENYGLCGSQNILAHLLQRQPTNLDEFIDRVIQNPLF